MSEGINPNSFQHLENLDGNQVHDLRSELERGLGSLEGERRDLRAERIDLVNRVRVLRNIVGGMEGADSERRELLRKFHETRKSADIHRKRRDEVNKLIPPPMEVLKEWLSETYRRLTTIDNDLTAVPTLTRELEAFRRFFEIQASITKKSESEDAHSEYVVKAKEMREITSQLDEGKRGRKDLEKRAESETGVEGKANRAEVRKISKRISKIDKRIESIDGERKSLRKELSMVRSYQRVTGGRNRKVRFSEIKAKAKTGGSLSTLELDALLGSGNLSDLAGSESETGAKSLKRITDTPKKRRKIGVSRRGPRKGNLATSRED